MHHQSTASSAAPAQAGQAQQPQTARHGVQPLQNRDIIVVGASAGGVEALTSVIASLPASLNAAVFVVLHIPPSSPSVLAGILTRRGHLEAHPAEDGERIKHGLIYVAVPDRHLLLHDGQGDAYVRLSRGPTENGHRPAVDTLFRSAALAFGRRVIGVVLSGNLDDGTAGLFAIKANGGIAISQDPETAVYPGMPRSAVDNVALDHILPLDQIGQALAGLVQEPLPPFGRAGPPREPMPAKPNSPKNNDQPNPIPARDREAAEVAMSELNPDAIHTHTENKSPDPIALIGNPSGFGCPHCGGALYEVKEHGFTRYRCRVGHAFSPASLAAAQNEGVDRALWSALRALEETASMCRRLADHADRRGNSHSAGRFRTRAQSAHEHAESIRRLLARGPGSSDG